MSLHFTGPCLLQTATGNTALSNLEEATLRFRVLIDEGSVTPTAFYPFRWNFTSMAYCGIGSLVTTVLQLLNNRTISYAGSYAKGVPIHVVLTHSASQGIQCAYYNGTLVAQRAYTDRTITTTQYMQMGQGSVDGLDAYVEDWLVLERYVTQDPVIADRDRSAYFQDVYSADIRERYTLVGTDGASVANGDAGIAGIRGKPFTVISGSGNAKWSSRTLDYTPPVEIDDARVLPGGKTFYVRAKLTADDSRVSPTSASSTIVPTLYYGDGSVASLGAPNIGTGNWKFRGVFYPITSRAYAEDESATADLPEGIMGTSQGVPVAATGFAVTNQTGGDMEPWDDPTMGLGVNGDFIGPPMLAEPFANLLKQSYAWNNVATYDALGRPLTLSATPAFCGVHYKTRDNSLDNLQGYGAIECSWYETTNPSYWIVGWDGPEAVSPYLRTNSGNLSNSLAIITERPDLDRTSGGVRYRYYQVNYPSNPTNYSLSLRLYISAPYGDDGSGNGSRVWVWGPGNSPDTTRVCNEYMANAYKGARVFRAMEMNKTNSSQIQDIADVKSIDLDRWSDAMPDRTGYVAYVDPLPPEYADIPDAHGNSGWMGAKITFTAPHGLAPRNNMQFNGAPYNLTYADPSNNSRATILTARDGVYTTIVNKPVYCFAVPDDYSICVSTYSSKLETGSPRYANAAPARQYFDPAKTWLFRRPQGVPVEAMAEVANGMSCDLWYCVPFASTDAAVEAMAERIWSTLAAGKKCWVELSNEIWNSGPGFAGQYIGAILQANLLGFGGETFQGPKYGAIRAAEVQDIFAAVAADYGRSGDMIRVLAGWYNGITQTAGLLAFAKARGLSFDAYAIADYIDVPTALRPSIRDYDVTQLCDFLELAQCDSYPQFSTGADSWYRIHDAALQANYPGAMLVTYEGAWQNVIDSSFTNSIPRAVELGYHKQFGRCVRRNNRNKQAAGVKVDVKFQDGNQFGRAEQPRAQWSMRMTSTQAPGDGSDNISAVGKPATLCLDGVNKSVLLNEFLIHTGQLPTPTPDPDPPPDPPPGPDPGPNRGSQPSLANSTIRIKGVRVE